MKTEEFDNDGTSNLRMELPEPGVPDKDGDIWTREVIEKVRKQFASGDIPIKLYGIPVEVKSDQPPAPRIFHYAPPRSTVRFNYGEPKRPAARTLASVMFEIAEYREREARRQKARPRDARAEAALFISEGKAVIAEARVGVAKALVELRRAELDLVSSRNK